MMAYFRYQSIGRGGQVFFCGPHSGLRPSGLSQNIVVVYDYSLFCGHCIKKSEPMSNRTPDFARSACVVALNQKPRPDRVDPPPRAEYRASRPLLLPLRFHSDFSRGGNSKKEWAAGGRGGFYPQPLNCVKNVVLCEQVLLTIVPTFYLCNGNEDSSALVF